MPNADRPDLTPFLDIVHTLERSRNTSFFLHSRAQPATFTPINRPTPNVIAAAAMPNNTWRVPE